MISVLQRRGHGMIKLSSEQVAVFLNMLSNWKYENNNLTKTYSHKSFKDALSFVNEIAILAEEANHHPDILIQHDRVTITLTTHDSHGVTGKDFSLAQQIETLK